MGRNLQIQKSQEFPHTYLYPERIYKIVVALLSCLKFQQKSKEKPLVLEEFVFILSLAVQEEE